MKEYLKLMRVKHYIKNILILLPLIFSGRLFETDILIRAGLGISAFCVMCSVIYIINDIRDAEKDRNHPVKCKRPIASGAITVTRAIIFSIFLLGIALFLNCLTCGFNIHAWVCFILYFTLNLLYSLRLKNFPIIDIAILVSGFLIRVIYGSCITGVEISKWLYLTVISASFYLGLGKRRNEISRLANNNTRKVLQYYNYNFLDKNMYMNLTLTIVFYSLWSIDEMTVKRIGSGNMLWTVPLVILICLKYSLTVEGSSDGDPVDTILKDKLLLAMLACLGIIIMGLIY